MTDVLPTSAGQSNDYQKLQDDLAKAKAEIAGPTPLIPDSPDCVVTLIRGVMYNGAWHRDAEVRELTGVDEEAFARIKRSGETFDAVITHGVVRLGQLRLDTLSMPERQMYLRQLLIGERDLLFLTVAKVTYGDQRVYQINCPACNKEQDLTVSLTDDFKPRDVTLEAENLFTTSKGLRVSFRLAIGADQLKILDKDTSSPAEMNTIMLSECILSVNDEMVVDPLNFARGLSIRDRQGLLAAMVKQQPSVDLTIKFDCIGCLEEQQISFGWLDLFRS